MSTETGKRRARRAQAERRDLSERKLLEAAAQVLAESGFAAATFIRIGEASGYSRGLATHKFGSKDGMVAAVLDFLVTRINENVEQRLQPAMSPLDQLLTYIDTVLESIQQDKLMQAYFVMTAAAVANKMDIQRRFLLQHKAIQTKIAKMIRAGQKSGQIRSGINANDVGLLIGSLQLGLGMELIIDPDLKATRYRTAWKSFVRSALEAA